MAVSCIDRVFRKARISPTRAAARARCASSPRRSGQGARLVDYHALIQMITRMESRWLRSGKRHRLISAAALIVPMMHTAAGRDVPATSLPNQLWRAHMGFLASDAMNGRGSGSPG